MLPSTLSFCLAKEALFSEAFFWTALPGCEGPSLKSSGATESILYYSLGTMKELLKAILLQMLGSDQKMGDCH